MSGLYVSSVEGHLVTRYGTGRRVNGIPMPGLLVGAERDPADPSKVVFDTTKIVFIPEQEAVTYAREYRRALQQGALKARTEDEFERQNARSAAPKE